jgi:hypothetical protein
MKKSSNKYVNYGIAFALFGILVFSLVMTPLEGFKEGADKKDKKTTVKSTTPSAKKGVKSEAFEADNLKETLSQLQHLAHLVKKDENDKSEPI